jgi:hypothetical protein
VPLALGKKPQPGNRLCRTRKRKLLSAKTVAARMEAIGEGKELASERVPVALEGAAYRIGGTRENVAARRSGKVVRRRVGRRID